MRLLWLWIIGAVVVWPIHWTAATVGDKPIDLMLSDLMFVLMPLNYLFMRSKPTKLQQQSVTGPIRAFNLSPILALIFIIYGTALAGIGLGMSGEMVRLYSAFKLVKPIAFVFLGLLLGSWTDPFEFIDITSRIYAIVVGMTMFFTVTSPDFPLGEWGKYIFEFELSGYPNSPMSFYAALLPLLLASVESTRHGLLQLSGWSLAACSTLMIMGSMSRSSTVALFCGIAVYLVMTGRIAYLLFGVFGITVVSVVGFGLFSILQETEFVAVLTDRVQDRVERSTEAEDPSSGRFEIWQLAIELSTERPVFGYMFESFSRYADVDTPHQQYLEVLHKCGGLGLLIYLSLLFSFFRAIRCLLRVTAKGSKAWYLLHAMTGMLVGVLTGNLTQPNLTYSLTGNMVFLLFGCLCSSRAMISASQPVAERPVSVAFRDRAPRQRVAA